MDDYAHLRAPELHPDDIAVFRDGERPGWLRSYPYRDFHKGVRCRRWLRYHPGWVVQFDVRTGCEVYWCWCGRRRWLVTEARQQVRLV